MHFLASHRNIAPSWFTIFLLPLVKRSPAPRLHAASVFRADDWREPCSTPTLVAWPATVAAPVGEGRPAAAASSRGAGRTDRRPAHVPAPPCWGRPRAATGRGPSGRRLASWRPPPPPPPPDARSWSRWRRLACINQSVLKSLWHVAPIGINRY